MEGIRSMSNRSASARMRWLVLLTALVLALGAAACGDDAESGDSPNAAQQGETRDFPDTPEGQVRETYATFVDTFYKRQPRLVCESLTAAARKELGQGRGVLDEQDPLPAAGIAGRHTHHRRVHHGSEIGRVGALV